MCKRQEEDAEHLYIRSGYQYRVLGALSYEEAKALSVFQILVKKQDRHGLDDSASHQRAEEELENEGQEEVQAANLAAYRLAQFTGLENFCS